MSKGKSEGETNWAEMDKRIRNRRWLWTAPDLEKLNQALAKLPDVASEAHEIELEQPAVGPRSTEVEAGTAGDPSRADGNPS